MNSSAVQKNILITGYPGVGKTTLIIKVANRLKAYNPIGFYTEEIRKTGRRLGFKLVSFDGCENVLAHVDIQSQHRVSKYRVDIEGFNKFLDKINFEITDSQLVIVDEIGKMECYSKKFQNLMIQLLNSNKPVIATIALKGSGFIKQVKERKDIIKLEVTQVNHEIIMHAIYKNIVKLI